MIRLAPLACVLLALSAVPPAHAHAQAPPVREVFSTDGGRVIRQTGVDVSGLDLSRKQDREMLMGRIEAAADAVCEAPAPGGPEPFGSPDLTRCRQRAIGETAYRFGSPQLWALAVARIRALGPQW